MPMWIATGLLALILGYSVTTYYGLSSLRAQAAVVRGHLSTPARARGRAATAESRHAIARDYHRLVAESYNRKLQSFPTRILARISGLKPIPTSESGTDRAKDKQDTRA